MLPHLQKILFYEFVAIIDSLRQVENRWTETTGRYKNLSQHILPDWWEYSYWERKKTYLITFDNILLKFSQASIFYFYLMLYFFNDNS